MAKATKDKRLTVRIPSDLVAALAKVAARQGRTVSAVVVAILAEQVTGVRR